MTFLTCTRCGDGYVVEHRCLYCGDRHQERGAERDDLRALLHTLDQAPHCGHMFCTTCGPIGRKGRMIQRDLHVAGAGNARKDRSGYLASIIVLAVALAAYVALVRYFPGLVSP